MRVAAVLRPTQRNLRQRPRATAMTEVLDYIEFVLA
ncbi:MAG: hypothetical protein QOE78_4017, partial [Alphaproteobacteria bacterium]|nr:hypothetical protein [Alphaproteobacteria bacterium]